MSGVMALLCLHGQPLPLDLARAQLSAIANRGDSEPRLWAGEGVALGHANRPTTPEAERELLPGWDPSGRFQLTWDGRLDNRAELAAELAFDAARARELTDADYVLAAYERWGAACVEHLIGDWAIIIWDDRERKLFCARDPIGLRPLFFAKARGMLAVGSEPQQLFAGGFVQPEANQDYVLRYLADAMQEEGATCYAGVRELEPGRSLTVRNANATVDRYWHGPRPRQLPYRRPDDYVQEFITTFERVVKALLRSNRGIAVSLSGGLDSSYVAAVAARCHGDLHALTMYHPGSRWCDERPYARLVVEHLGIAHTEVDISDCWALSSRWLPDDSFDDPHQPPQGPHFMKLAARAQDTGAGVVLDGEGGDDWLTGQDWYIADAVLRGRFTTAWRLAGVHAPVLSRARAMARHSFYGLVPFTFQDAVARLRRRPTAQRFRPLTAAGHGWVSPQVYCRALLWQRRRLLHFDRRLYHNRRMTLSWRDRQVLKRYRIEPRSPFNDARIIRLMASTPEWIKCFNGRPKDLLREAGYRVLPAAIFDRRDKAIFSELVLAGIRTHERGRLLRGVTRAARFPGVEPALATEIGVGSADVGLTDWHAAWSLTTTGLWLGNLDAHRSRAVATCPPALRAAG